jgi:hypothetical protein
MWGAVNLSALSVGWRVSHFRHEECLTLFPTPEEFFLAPRLASPRLSPRSPRPFAMSPNKAKLPRRRSWTHGGTGGLSRGLETQTPTAEHNLEMNKRRSIQKSHNWGQRNTNHRNTHKNNQLLSVESINIGK